MELTLNKAAQACGHSKSTLLDAIRSGRLTAPKDDRGRYAIDPAELHRVFPFLAPGGSGDRTAEPTPTTRRTASTTLADRRVEILAREAELLREMLARAEENADRWRAMAERQQVLLEHYQSKAPRSFLGRLLGRRAAS